MRVLLPLVLPAAIAAAIIVPLSSQTSLPTGLVQQSDLTHIGSFNLPTVQGNGDRGCFEYQYPGAMGYNPATHSLIIVGHDWDQWVGEVNIPASFGSGTTATVRQSCRDILYGKRSQIPGESNPVKIGGFLVRGSDMLVSGFPYYANGTADGTHWSRSTTFTSSAVRDVVRVGNTASATIGGYMAHIPAEWQAPLKGDMLTGQCCISVISRSSFGPSVSSTYFSDVLTQSRPNATTLVNYPAETPLAPYGVSTPTELWNGYTRIRGVAMPGGTASVLFFGRHGTGSWCYGTGSACNDPIYGEQGEHAYPYRAQVWAYNAHELAQVAAGTRQPQGLRPYAVWALPGFQGAEVAGAALDKDGLLYVLENGGAGGGRGRVHVYRVTGSTAPPPQQADTVAPSVTLNVSPGTVSGTITLSASASDNVGVAGVWFTVNGVTVGAEDTSAPYQTTWNTTTAGNGAHGIQAMARDAAGNTATSAGVTVTVSNQTADTTAPTVSLSAPAAGATVSGTVAVSATASDNVGVSSVQFTLNGVNLGSADTTAPYSINWNTTGAANGTHTLRAVARDAAGNTTTSAARTVTVSSQSADIVLPSVSLSSPTAGAVVSGTTTLEAAASDNVAVTGVRFMINGVQVGAEVTSAPYRVSWNTLTASDGNHGLQAVARDTSGNVRMTAASTVTVRNNAATPPTATSSDTSAPTVSMTGPSTWRTHSGTVTVSANASDNVGVASVQFTLNGQNLGAPVTVAPYTLSWNTATVSNGSHALRAVARDAAGNVRTSAARTVQVSNSSAAQAAAQGPIRTDFNGDQMADVLFQHTSGQLYTWFMNGSSRVGERALSPAAISPAWKAIAVNDFNRDGKADVLWQLQTTGQLALWVMDGTQVVIETGIANGAHSTWKVMATGDLNGDGHTDIIWQHPASGYTKIWLMNFWTVVTEAGLSPYRADPNWRIAGSADMNGDGRDDLVWQHRQSGEVSFWHIGSDGRTTSSKVTVARSAPGTAWMVKAVADFDRDGSPDILWQNSQTGALLFWFMNGETVGREEASTPAQSDAAWRVTGSH